MLRVARILSLDVVLGACVSSWFVSTVVGSPVSEIAVVTLGIAVWLIYTADHLWDAYRVSHIPHTPRHRFHQQHFRTILVVFGLIALVGAFNLFYLPPSVLRFGVLLLVGVAIYFIVFQITSLKRYLPKELAAALLYASGVFLPTVAQLSSYPPELVLLFIQYFGLALANLCLFAWFECQSDQLDFAQSLATQYGRKKTRVVAIFSIALVMILVFTGSSLVSRELMTTYTQLIILVMAAMLLAILFLPNYFSQKERYRWVGDGIFIIPLILYPLLP